MPQPECCATEQASQYTDLSGPGNSAVFVHNTRMYRYLALGLFVITGCTPSQSPRLGEPEPFPFSAEGNLVGPRFAEGPDGRLVMSWMRRDEAGATLFFAPVGDKGFGSPTDVVSDAKMFVNWADMPSVMPLEGDHWVAQWLSYSAELTYSYDVVVAQSFDGGETWSGPVAAHTDGTPTEHGFVSMHRETDGVALLWLDGRQTGGEQTEDPLDTAMTLRAVIMTRDGERLRRQLVDDAVCDCCQTDVAVSAAGPIAVYRNRTGEEIRDIYVSRYADGRWSAGEPLHTDNWVIPGCPVNGPSISANGQFVAVAWFAAPEGRPRVSVLLSSDGGLTFGKPIQIAAEKVSGYVGTALIDDRTLAVSWLAKGEDGPNIVRVRLVDAEGTVGPVVDVGDTSQVRVVPQLGRSGDRLVLAWTDGELHQSRIESVSVPILGSN